MSDERDPWERQPGESGRAYEAFRLFRDLGPARSLREVPGTAYRTLARWRTDHRWIARAQAWDAEVHRLDDERRLEEIRQMDDTHQRAARALITAGLRALADNPQLTPHQAARFIQLGTGLQRSTLLGEHLPALPVASVTDDEELSPLERIARELAGTA